MKYAIPEISWHNRDPVLSVDFQPKCGPKEPLRLATGGTDSHVLIWHISTTESGTINVDVAADMTRHQKAVNVVRWSPNGQFLASGDDEAVIFIWKQNLEKVAMADQMDEEYKECWTVYKTLRGHMEDVLDISWSPDSLHLASGSVDNKLLLWDLNRGKYSAIITDHKGFVQGVAWDPKGQYIATTSTDRVFRTFDISSKKVTSRSSKAILPFPPGHPFHNTPLRLYHDDTLQTFYRRVQFSPDGTLVAVPAGKIEPEQGRPGTKPINSVFVYTRFCLKTPVCVLPVQSPALVVRWRSTPMSVREGGPPPSLPTAHRMVLAVATKDSVLLYDTQQKSPIAVINNIHYTRLTDLCWSPDGLKLVASSTDGFCSVISFTEGELGDDVQLMDSTTEPMEVAEEPAPKTNTQTNPEPKQTEPKPSDTKPINRLEVKRKPTTTIDKFMKFKSPTQKSPTKKNTATLKDKTPVKMDVLSDAAMPSWSDNSNNEVIKPKIDEAILIEDSGDFKLVYEESQTQSEHEKPNDKELVEKTENSKPKTTDLVKKIKESKKKTTEVEKNANKSESDKETGDDSPFLKKAKLTDVKEPAQNMAQSPKAPRRVSFVTLSSPKSKKK